VVLGPAFVSVVRRRPAKFRDAERAPLVVPLPLVTSVAMSCRLPGAVARKR
jgi:hypothetical protein